MSQTTTLRETAVSVPMSTGQPILAVGAEFASAPALMLGRKVFVGQEGGHLNDPVNYRRFLTEIDALQQRHDARAEIVAYDLHPEYAATRYARTLPSRQTGVQHHHAHIAACMAEHGLTGTAVGLACDGTGYGTDGTIWGGEVLTCDFDAGAFERSGHLRPFPLLGGDAAAIETYRPALGLLAETYGNDRPDSIREILERIAPQARALAERRLAAPSARLPRTSSLGRVFDGVAFLLNLCDRNDTDAQAPIALQQVAERSEPTEAFPYDIESTDADTLLLDYRPMVRAMLDRANLRGDMPVDTAARAFHETLINMLVDAADRICERRNEHRVVLAGGCFVNALLRNGVEERLRARGRKVYIHQQLSPGDASVALGQAVIAAARNRKGAI